MIKVKASQPPAPVPAVEFPVLARVRDSGMVVLFVEDGAGVVLEKGDGYPEVGFFQTIWSSVTNPFVWEVLPPSYNVTISNG